MNGIRYEEEKTGLTAKNAENAQKKKTNRQDDRMERMKLQRRTETNRVECLTQRRNDGETQRKRKTNRQDGNTPNELTAKNAENTKRKTRTKYLRGEAEAGLTG